MYKRQLEIQKKKIVNHIKMIKLKIEKIYEKMNKIAKPDRYRIKKKAIEESVKNLTIKLI